MSTSAQVHAMFEASSGDMIDDVEPVFISLRASESTMGASPPNPGPYILLVNVRVADRAMTATYDIVDPKLDPDDVLVLFCETYLRRFTGDHWRDRVDTITLVPRDGEAHTPFAYPRWEADEVDAGLLLAPLLDVEAQVLLLREHIDEQMLRLNGSISEPARDEGDERDERDERDEPDGKEQPS